MISNKLYAVAWSPNIDAELGEYFVGTFDQVAREYFDTAIVEMQHDTTEIATKLGKLKNEETTIKEILIEEFLNTENFGAKNRMVISVLNLEINCFSQMTSAEIIKLLDSPERVQ